MECCICYEEVSGIFLECKHPVHKECLEKHFKAECPMCRRPVDIKVNGVLYRHEDEFAFIEDEVNEDEVIEVEDSDEDQYDDEKIWNSSKIYYDDINQRQICHRTYQPIRAYFGRSNVIV